MWELRSRSEFHTLPVQSVNFGQLQMLLCLNHIKMGHFGRFTCVISSPQRKFRVQTFSSWKREVLLGLWNRLKSDMKKRREIEQGVFMKECINVVALLTEVWKLPGRRLRRMLLWRRIRISLVWVSLGRACLLLKATVWGKKGQHRKVKQTKVTDEIKGPAKQSSIIIQSACRGR